MNTALRELEHFKGFADELGRIWFEHSDESIFVVAVEPDRFVLEALNPAHERRTGLRSVAITGKSPHDFLPAELADTITANYRRCLESGETIRYDETLDLSGGPRRWRTVLTPIRDEEGRICRILGSARDVTAELEAREWADATRRLMQEMIGASPDILYVFDLDEDRNAFIGGRFGEILGWSKDYLASLSGRTMAALVHPEDLPVVREHLAGLRLLGDGDVADVEYRMRCSDGRYVWLRSRERAFVRGQDGRVIKVFGAASCIQEAKRVEVELRVLNRRLASTLASIAECYFTLDCGYRITDVNQACLDWLGRTRAEVVGLDFWGLCQPHHECGAATKLGMDGRQVIRRELRSALRPDRWLDFRVFPSEEGVTVFFRDITEGMSARCEERRAKGLLQATLDALSAHVAILDANGTIVAVNQAWHHFAELNLYPSADHAVGLNYIDICRAAAPEDVEASRVAEGLSAVLSGQRSGFSLEYNCGDRSFLLRAARFTHAGAIHVVVAHEDVTDLVLTKRDLAETADRLLHVQDEERQRIGAELHDSTTQHLTAAGLGLARAHVLVSKSPDIEAALGSVGMSIEEAQREIRTLSFLLYPPNLERDGLVLTLRDFVHGFARRAGLMARVRLDPAIDEAGTHVCRAVLRVVQEALANIRRHARATRIFVEIRRDSRAMRLRISDDGIGLPKNPSSAPRPKLGVGIPGMQARVRQLGGELSVTNGRKGALVRAVIPLTAPTNGTA